jgi:hypothetical protein
MDHFISLDQAVQKTTLFRENRDKVIVQDLVGQNILPNAETFDRAAFDALLAQPGCERLRIYYGMSEDLQVHAIVVGVNAENQDILPVAQSSSTTGEETAPATESGDDNSDNDGLVVEAGVRCPPDCGTPSPLNP